MKLGLGLSLVLGFVSGIAGCSAFKAVEPATVECVSTILSDAAAGKTFAQILADSVPCGGDVLTTVIETLLASAEPNVQSSVAFKDAVALKNAGASHAK